MGLVMAYELQQECCNALNMREYHRLINVKCPGEVRQITSFNGPMLMRKGLIYKFEVRTMLHKWPSFCGLVAFSSITKLFADLNGCKTNTRLVNFLDSICQDATDMRLILSIHWPCHILGKLNSYG